MVFESRGDYFDLFNATETFVNDIAGDALRAAAAGEHDRHVGRLRREPAPRASSRTARVLAAGAKFDDTSPTQRGMFVRNRLLCQDDPAAAART